MIRLYNTLTRKKEELQTLEPGLVKLYVCGPTVYNDAHVGHAMSALVFDIIRRYLEYRGFNVRHVMNYTDVDDKIISRANQMGVDPFELSKKYIDDFDQNLEDLNILPATAKPRVSKTMPQIIDFIQGLVERKAAYAAPNGDVYFSVVGDEDYGKLSGRKLDDMQAGARIQIEETKQHPMDFALWKAAKPGEPAWDSPWGQGRPGWHIECSAMNLHELGEQIDIHGGGNDLIFPHHENEIAQTESYTGKQFARYWMHNGMLQLGSEKMSKSIGNIISIKEFLSKRDPDVMRMLVLNANYRSPLMFNDESLDGAEKGLERIKSALKPAHTAGAGAAPAALAALEKQTAATRQAFLAAMDDDFNSAGALGGIFELVRAINAARDANASDPQLQPAQDSLRELAGVFGLRLSEKTGSGGADPFIDLLLEVRAEVRAQKLWALSDLIRDRLKALGVTVEDNKQGSSWHW
ncbi:MAG: cysteine--tRNA ligase [Anaerolineales bacterium]|jgi:cysteinyl-tRNA synthetase|nr:cysteine--tRNA ligase [Anaerolineales bacterium]